MDAQTVSLFPLWYAAFLLALTCHEAGHALVAKWGGDDTAYLSGQVSLNPWPHIRREPFGTVLVPILTYFTGSTRWMMGWASAPYDPGLGGSPSSPRRTDVGRGAGREFRFVCARLCRAQGRPTVRGVRRSSRRDRT